jgi:hypothetical protein
MPATARNKQLTPCLQTKSGRIKIKPVCLFLRFVIILRDKGSNENQYVWSRNWRAFERANAKEAAELSARTW